MTEYEFERLVRRSEELAASPELRSETTEFDLLVADAIDELPLDFQRVLDDVPVVVSRRGAENRAYGHYFGDTVARDNYPDRIVLYQDTLERDFGWDRDLLRRPGRADPPPRAGPPPRLERARGPRTGPLGGSDTGSQCRARRPPAGSPSFGGG